jgi:hypothetical protein
VLTSSFDEGFTVNAHIQVFRGFWYNRWIKYE